MNDQQIKIGDKLLELFIENDGKMTEPAYLSLLNKYFNPANNVLIITTSNIMIEDYGLFRRGVKDESIKIITANGYNAAKIGLRQFISEFEENKQLEKENLRANIKTAKLAEKNSRKSLNISIFALIAAVFAPILATILGFYIENYSSFRNSNNNYKNKENIINTDTAKKNVNDFETIKISK